MFGWDGIAAFATSRLGRILAVLLLLAAIVWGVNHMLDSARQAGRDEVQAAWNAEKEGRARASAELTSALVLAIDGVSTKMGDAVKNIRVEGQTITVRLNKEIEDDPRYTAPECALTDGVRDDLNAARGLSHGPPTFSGVERAVPTGNAVARFDFSDAGD